ncbi:MAG: Gldg family protein, partial [Candidatus Competibacterales bacterium]|nr:Gldg family protein [Candidatus Competibacterales bacterium]
EGGVDPILRRPEPPWVITQQLGQLYEVRTLDPAGLTAIDDDIDVLLLAHPKDLDEQALYAIDQFVLRGGRALIFVDPHAEADSGDPRNPQAAMFAEKSSDLPRLFESWGIAYDPAQVIGDRRYALQVQVSADQAPVRHLGILSLDPEALAADDVITGELSTVNLALGGALDLVDDAPVTLEPLLRSSEFAMPIDAETVRFMPDPSTLQRGFEPTGERYVLAARVRGEVPSAFPDGPPSTEEESAAEGEHRSRSDGPINLVIAADADLLSDRLWVRRNDFFGQQLTSAWANNGDFVINAVDNLLGNNALLSLRGRATSNRPFLKVQALQRQADAQFRAKEQELQNELQETQDRLNELQRQRGQTLQSDSELILTPEQQAEVERLRQRLLEVRQELRQVRRNLDQDIERLGDWLKFINIALMPLLVTVIGLLAALTRRRRRAVRTAH